MSDDPEWVIDWMYEAFTDFVTKRRPAAEHEYLWMLWGLPDGALATLDGSGAKDAGLVLRLRDGTRRDALSAMVNYPDQ